VEVRRRGGEEVRGAEGREKEKGGRAGGKL
jgi:hypothetical protein